ncbi:MAG: tetratricopeptide repeat protein [Planctomycetota bacterium]
MMLAAHAFAWFALSALAPQAAPDAPPRGALLERWHDALELDLATEVVADGVPRVTKDGALAQDGEALALVSRALFATGERERARALLASAPRDARTTAWLAIEEARQAIESDELERAVRLLAEGETVRYPGHAACWYELARARTRAGEAQTAQPLLDGFLARAPLAAEASAAWHMKMQAALQRRDAAGAERCRAEAQRTGQWRAFYRARRLQIRESPREPLPRLGLAELWLAAGDGERAKAVLDELLALAPDFCRAYETLGEAHAQLGDAPAARASFDRALACDPELTSAYFARGSFLARAGEHAAAREDLERVCASAAAAQPRFLRAHRELARTLRALGDVAAAERAEARFRELGGRD